MIDVHYKKCYGCQKVLSILEFGKDKYRSDHLTTRCKSCRNKQGIQWRKRNPEIVKKINDSKKESRKNYYASPKRKLHLKNLELKRAFGISLIEYNEMLKKQNGVCAICWNENRSTRYKYLSVDHCHKTGKIRGLLCYLCNGAIGMLREDLQILNNAIQYLERRHQ